MPSVTTAVIPAAGFGTRFLPATKAQPKEMLTVVDKPVIQYIVEEAVASGITDIIIITGQSKRAIEDHFDRNFELETRLQEQKKTTILKEVRRISTLANFIYVRQKEALGDGHALLAAYSLLKDEPFAVLFGDCIIDSAAPALRSLLRVYEEFRSPVVGVIPVPKREVYHYGIIGGTKLRPNLYQVTTLIEKPAWRKAPSNLAASGRYVLTPEFLSSLKRTPRGLTNELRTADAVPHYLKHHPVYACVHGGVYHDCGNKLGLLKANMALGLRHPDIKRDLSHYLKTLC